MGKAPTLNLRAPKLHGRAATARHQLFGEWLVEREVLSHARLTQALSVGRRHEWRLGDAVVVLRFASRRLVEEEAQLFERHTGRCEPRRLQLEQRAERLMREELERRLRRDAADGPRG